MMLPLIGITSYAEPAAWGHWQAEAALVPLSYVRAVDAAGGRPLVVPPVEGAVDETLDALDGLLLSGGSDLDPCSYGARRLATTSAQVERDRAELALLEAALARELPVLGVCRGMQLLNVVRRGTLHQHLPYVVGHNGHRETRGAFSVHDVTLQDGSQIAAILGSRARVLSTHHQGPDRVGDRLAPVGWAEDGTIEAIEDRDLPFALGVLWHPEEGADPRLLEAFVENARRYREGLR